MSIILSDVLTTESENTIIDAGEASGNLVTSTSFADLQSEILGDDVVMFSDIPSSAKIKSLLFSNDELDSGTTLLVDIGLYASERFVMSDGTILNENDVIQHKTFSDNTNLLTSPVSSADLRFFLSGLAFLGLGGYKNSQFQLWELAGSALGEDPFIPLRIGMRVTQQASAFQNGTILLIVNYTGKI